MPPAGCRVGPREYPHYRAGLTPGSKWHTLTHQLPDGTVVSIRTTCAFRYAVIGHSDLGHKLALARRKCLRLGYEKEHALAATGPFPFRESLEEYVAARERAVYEAALAQAPTGPWALLRWSHSAATAARAARLRGSQWAAFFEPINNGQRESAWPIASMTRLQEMLDNDA